MDRPLLFPDLTWTQTGRLLFEVTCDNGLPDLSSMLDLLRAVRGSKPKIPCQDSLRALALLDGCGWTCRISEAVNGQLGALYLVRASTTINVRCQQDSFSLGIDQTEEGRHILRVLAGWLTLPEFASLVVCVGDVKMTAGRWVAIQALRNANQEYEASVLWDLAEGG